MSEASTETTTTATETTAPAGTFTQADLDRIVGERLAKQKAQFKDYDDLRTKASEFDRLTESQKSDLQKAQDRAEKAEQAVAAASQRVVMAEVRAIATGEFEDPTDAHLYLGDVSKLVDKNGEPDSAAIEEALKDVLKAKPHLAAKSRSTDVGLGARGSTAAPDMNDFIRQGAGRR